LAKNNSDAAPDATLGELEETAAREGRRAVQVAVRLLAKRDHSSNELRSKLGARGFDEQSVDYALQEMEQHGYLDDVRFATLFAEQRMEKGLGPRGISAKLRERGIDDSLCRQSVSALNADWQEMAEIALCKRFSSADLLSEETRQKARMARFLESRGFSTGDSIRAIEKARRSASV